MNKKEKTIKNLLIKCAMNSKEITNKETLYRSNDLFDYITSEKNFIKMLQEQSSSKIIDIAMAWQPCLVIIDIIFYLTLYQTPHN